jgi:hypothetical protein
MRRPEVVFGKFVGEEADDDAAEKEEERRYRLRMKTNIFFYRKHWFVCFFSTEAFASPQRGLDRSSPVTNGFVKFDRTSERKQGGARRGATKRLVSGAV